MGIIFRVLSLSIFLFTSSFLLAQDGLKHLIHVVKPGETLYGIAKTYNVSIEELMQFNEEINKMKEIKEGSTLLVPDRRAALEKESEEPRTSAALDTPKSKFIYHEVQRQETLYSLSKQYGVSTEALIAANPVIEKEGLKAGFLLRVPREKEDEAQGFVAQNDSLFYLHSVQKQETAYSLGKQYKITIDSLYILNPEIKAGLKLGQLLRIPKNRSRYAEKPIAAKSETPAKTMVKEAPKKPDTVSSDSDYMLYKVKGGDTFFNLKQRYFVEQEELVKINPELEKGLIVGKYIIIPKKLEAAEINWLDKILNNAESGGEVTAAPLSGETVGKKESLNSPEKVDTISEEVPGDSLLVDTAKEYRVALMLPFRSSRYKDSLDAYSFFPHRDTEMSSQFYYGFRIAADSLAKRGMRLNLKLYDTEGDLSVTKSYTDELLQRQLDLIVGPAYNKNSEYIADKMKETGVPVISPLSKSVDIKNRPNLIKMVPDEAAKASTIADLLNSKFATANILFAHCSQQDQEKNVEEIMARLEPRENAFVMTMSDCDELASTKSLNDKLYMDGTKVVVLMSDDAVFISDMISKLYGMKDSAIYLIGSPSVLKSPTVEYSYLNALHFTTYEVINTNYENRATKAFVAKFRKDFKEEPNAYAFQGYDAGLYFLELLWKNGPYFLESLNDQKKLSTGYKFEKSPEDGIRNSFFIHSSIKSYQLKRLN
tara:strand:+ start:4950 stop:7082 length:2133 start_codon:yes stop_codon:yes gene_type:complete